MKFCPMCGKENLTESPYCLACGANLTKKQEPIVQQAAPRPQPAEQYQHSAPSVKSAPARKASTADVAKILKIAVPSAVAVIVAVIVIAVLATGVSLDKYIAKEIAFSGVNGYGTADYSDLIDYVALDADLTGRKQKDYDDYSEEDFYEEMYYEFSGGRDISSYIDVVCLNENNGRLSNGDTVEFEITVDKNDLGRNKYFKKNLRCKEKFTEKFKVSGLVEPEKINVLDVVESVTVEKHIDGIKEKYDISLNYKEGYAEGMKAGNYTIRLSSYGEKSAAVYVDGAGDDGLHAYMNVSCGEFNPETGKVNVSISIEPDSLVGKGVVFEPASVDFDANVYSQLSGNNISQASFDTLKDNAAKLVAAKAGVGYKLAKAMIIVANNNYNNGENRISFVFQSTEGFVHIHYDWLMTDENGNIKDVENLEPHYDEDWLRNIVVYKEASEITEAYDNNFSIYNVEIQ